MVTKKTAKAVKAAGVKVAAKAAAKAAKAKKAKAPVKAKVAKAVAVKKKTAKAAPVKKVATSKASPLVPKAKKSAKALKAAAAKARNDAAKARKSARAAMKKADSEVVEWAKQAMAEAPTEGSVPKIQRAPSSIASTTGISSRQEAIKARGFTPVLVNINTEVLDAITKVADKAGEPRSSVLSRYICQGLSMHRRGMKAPNVADEVVAMAPSTTLKPAKVKAAPKKGLPKPPAVAPSVPSLAAMDEAEAIVAAAAAETRDGGE